jgi:hypothetical protein
VLLLFAAARAQRVATVLSSASIGRLPGSLIPSSRRWTVASRSMIHSIGDSRKIVSRLRRRPSTSSVSARRLAARRD